MESSRDAAPAHRPPLRLFHLAWPIMVENLLRVSLMSVDTVMLGHYSAKAVAAMSLVNQFAFFIQLLYMMVSTGASILIAQNLGAGRRREAGLIGVGSLVLMLALSLVVSAAFALGSSWLVGPVQPRAPGGRVRPRSSSRSTGGCRFFMALNIGQASILRAWGYSRDPMLVNVLALFMTVGGNALCLFGPFGFPVLGVVGVAASTVVSQAVATVLSFWLIRRRAELELPLHEARRIPRRVYRSMLAVGVPTTGENLSYNLSQIAILAMLSRLGTASLAAYGILLAVLRYVFMPGASIGAGAQIKVGYLVGAERYDEAKRSVYRAFAVAFCFSLVAVLLVQWLHRPILALFTDDPEVLGLAGAVLVVALVHEPGRNFNTVIIPALKGSGDVRFPVYVGMASMWGVGVVGAWIIGVRLGYGLPGVWAAMAADEWLRGGVMFLRWRSDAWRSKALLGAEEGGALSAIEVAEGL